MSRSAPKIAVLLVLLLAPSVALAQVALNYVENGVTIGPSGQISYTIDLSALPDRAGLRIEAGAAPGEDPVGLQVELSSWSGIAQSTCAGGTWFSPGYSVESDANPPLGPVVFETSLARCNPDTTGPEWENATVDVIVRVTDWGSAGPSVDVNLKFRGRTLTPTSDEWVGLDTTFTVESEVMTPMKDTVLYESDTTTSNGAGQNLWAGHDYQLVGGPVIFIKRWYGLKSLLAFDVANRIPIGSNVLSADLRLRVTDINGLSSTVRLYETAPGIGGATWDEGNAIGPGDQLTGGGTPFSAANWLDRQGTVEPWATPGGDVIGGELDAELIDSLGYVTFLSSGLNDSVQYMIDTRDDDHGFLLEGPFGGVLSVDFGIQFASSEHPTTVYRPRLTVFYEPSGPHAEGEIYNGTESFVNEGQNFRWIYDTDGDRLLTTSIGGICEALDLTDLGGTHDPYAYSYSGPAYTGTDCCAWQIESDTAGIVGTGVATFFHNLAPTEANAPLDVDGDGMRDPCDNCPNTPNGPLLGSCIGLAGISGDCISDLDCGLYEFCSQAQEDVDLDGTGDACSVPEPGFGVALLGGTMALGRIGRRRRAPRSR